MRINRGSHSTVHAGPDLAAVYVGQAAHGGSDLAVIASPAEKRDPRAASDQAPRPPVGRIPVGSAGGGFSAFPEFRRGVGRARPRAGAAARRRRSRKALARTCARSVRAWGGVR